MRFSGMQASDYSRAGKAVARDFENTLDVARTYSPKADEQVIAADTIRAKEKIAAMKIKGEVTARGIRAAGSVKADKMEIQGRMKVRKAKRKAGVLAAGGKLVGEAGELLGQDPRSKRVVGEDSAALLSQEEKAREQAAKWRGKNNDLTSTDTTSTAGSTNTGTDGELISSGQAVAAGKSKGSKGGKFSQSEMTQFAIGAGFTPEQARIMGAIGMGESGGDSGIDTSMTIDPNKSNEYSIGLFQINAQAHGDKLAKLGYTEDDLRDPAKNAQVAKMVYDEVGSFSPWSVYSKGIYKDYL